ncbi:sulfotransferase [Flavobacteriaceae bacterium]|nr:sulfotransferase [Flavobacteriaceae bacterium]
MVGQEFKVDFFVVGAARSGTTTLYQYLSKHPDN